MITLHHDRALCVDCGQCDDIYTGLRRVIEVLDETYLDMRTWAAIGELVDEAIYACPEKALYKEDIMIDAGQLRELIAEILDRMGWGGSRVGSAINLLLGTVAQESRLGSYLRQVGGGPALGIFQMEPDTEADIWDSYLYYRPHIVKKISQVCNHDGPGPWLKFDLAYQIIMARLHYLRVPDALPDHFDIAGLAAYWKQHYNTPAGRGTVDEFIKNYQLTR